MVNSDMKATNAALHATSPTSTTTTTTTKDDTLAKLGTATHTLVRLTDQNTHLHSALKKAREHILLQDRLLKESKSGGANGDVKVYQEAIQSFEAQVRDKESEIELLKGELNKVKEKQSRAWLDGQGLRGSDWLREQRNLL
jgi:hypothetical protein